jgi:CheY-like chemotaxis protein
MGENRLDGTKRGVLIADGNSGRGRRLASALSIAGIPSEAVRDGASALDRALTARPALVVAELELPLVDSDKLSEILRANPRTRSLRMLFLGDRATSSSSVHVGDQVMPQSSRPNDIVDTVLEMLEKQERIDAVEAASAEGGAVEGELSQLSLAELLERFHAGAKSGRLRLTRDRDGGGEASAEILVRNGDVIAAEAGEIENEKALFRLLAWPGGHFVFTPEDHAEAASIETPTRILLAEGMRQLAEWDRLAPKLPPLDARVSLQTKRSELPNIVHPLTRDVLTLLESCTTVSQVVDRSSFPDYQVLRTLHTLAEREIVELGRVPLPERVLAADEGEALLHEGQGRRLQEWLQGGSPVGVGPRSAKLLVVSSEPEALHDFTRLIESVPAVNLAEEWHSEGEATARDFSLIGRIEVDEKVGIELLHVPLDRRFSPLWSLAGHSALGTLFLLSGSVSQAAGRVREMTETLRRLPPARLFHVVQFRKDERVSPDDLRDNLELIDEASLFLLPLESRKPSASLLRRLLARVIP